MQLQADAIKLLEEAGGEKEYQKIALLNAKIGAAKAHEDSVLRSIELMQKATSELGDVEYGTDATRVLGLGGTSSDQGPQEGPQQG